MIDLHSHTTASDGSFSFEELVEEAEKARLKALAITDHDNIRSASKIRTKTSAVELIAGVELTVFDPEHGYEDIHMLGLFIDTASIPLNKKLKELEAQRLEQKIATVEKLNVLGYSITFAQVKAKAQGAVGRPHIAMVLLERYPEEFSSISDVFVKLLGRGKKGYVGRDSGFGLREAVNLVRMAGGLSFIAHPEVYKYDPGKLLSDFKSLGGDGVEVYYDYITNRPEVKISIDENRKLIEKYQKLAGELALLESGGSDFHGKNKGQTLGLFGAPDPVLPRLKASLRKPL